GWVLQECILAPRVLYFGSDQILWQCRETDQSETFPAGYSWVDSVMNELGKVMKLGRHRESGKMNNEAIAFWIDIVEQYSECTLTNQTDRLPAIAGIAKFFKDITGEEYLAGMWESRPDRMLSWRVFSPQKIESPEYRAPSWSWISTEGRLIFAEIPFRKADSPKLLDFHIGAQGPDNLTGISEGYIKLRADILRVEVARNRKRDILRVSDKNGLKISLVFSPDRLNTRLRKGDKLALICLGIADDDSVNDDPGSDSSSSATTLRYIVHYLVLFEVFDSASSEARYRRVGYGRCGKISRYIECDSAIEDITII
ncbi:hypothetical protein F5Y11DRAFT_365229, partial [Daldinia sp. FL1419]